MTDTPFTAAVEASASTIETILENGIVPNISTTPEQTKKIFQTLIEKFCRKKEYDKALSFFHLLVLLAPDDATAWINYGMCLEMVNDYSEAIIAYTKATELDPKNPLPPFRSAHCWMSQKKNGVAIEALDECLRRSEKKDELYERALTTKQLLEQETASAL